jgi:hypothetical protein
VGQRGAEDFEGVADRQDGIAVGVVVERRCEAGLGGIGKKAGGGVLEGAEFGDERLARQQGRGGPEKTGDLDCVAPGAERVGARSRLVDVGGAVGRDAAGEDVRPLDGDARAESGGIFA